MLRIRDTVMPSPFLCVEVEVIFTHMIICLLHIGTFLGRSAAESEADCEACYPGSYCPSWAQTSVDLLCPPGWFCPPGSVSGHQPGTVYIIRGQLRFNHRQSLHFIIFFLSFFTTQCLITYNKSGFRIVLIKHDEVASADQALSYLLAVGGVNCTFLHNGNGQNDTNYKHHIRLHDN